MKLEAWIRDAQRFRAAYEDLSPNQRRLLLQVFEEIDAGLPFDQGLAKLKAEFGEARP